MSTINEIFISSSDARELDRLLSDVADTHDASIELSAKLFDAYVVSAETLPHGTVGLNSTVTYQELPGQARRRVTLVLPHDADARAGRISVLSPVGRSLLGHRVGRIADVTLPGDRHQAIRVVDVAPATENRPVEPVAA